MGRNIIQLFLLLLLTALNSATTANNTDIEETFKLLKEGDEKVELAHQHKNVILLLGNTGSGKSTLVQWIAGDNNKLISKEVGRETAEYIIEDEGNGRIGSSLKSKTIFPELVFDETNGAAYYDCPGFSDTRSTSYDIASTYFIKKIADHVSSVKIVLVVGHSSVRKGVDRRDFVQLLKHTTDLIKDVEKFRGSIALAVTKVENAVKREGYNYFLVPDENIISSIASFLRHDVISYLEDKSMASNTSDKETLFFKNAIKFTNILLQSDSPRIVIFRRPDQSGPLSNISLLQDGKTHVSYMFHKVLQFTEKNGIDFGYTISEASKNDVNSFVEKINDKVIFEVSEINEKIKSHHMNSLNKMYEKINSFMENEMVVNVTEANAFTFELDRERRIISALVGESRKITNIHDLLRKTNDSVILLGVNNCMDNLENILIQGRYFEFVQVVSDKKLKISPWWGLFEKTEIYLLNSMETLNKDVQIFAEKINEKLWSEFNEINEKIKNHHKSLINEIHGNIDILSENDSGLDVADAKAFAAKLESERRIISTLLADSSDITNVNDFLGKTNQSITVLGIDDCMANMRNISLQCQYFDYLEAISDNKFRNSSSKPWWKLFEKTESYISQSKNNLGTIVLQAAEKINLIINSFTESVAKNIENNYENQIDILEIEQLPTAFYEGFQVMSQFNNESKSFIDIKEFIEKISGVIKNLKLESVSEIKTDMLSISRNSKGLEYLKIINNGLLNMWSPIWMQPFDNMEKHFSESVVWYKFLNKLYVKLSEYDIQLHKNKYNVLEMNDWGRNDKPQGIYIDNNNFKQFLAKIHKSFLIESSLVHKLQVTESQIKKLNEVLDLTLKKSISAQCLESGEWIIKGDFIKFSDFVSKKGQIIDLCTNNKVDLNAVHIFSVNTVFIDRNLLEIGSKLNLTIVAPKWHIIGDRKISLDGAPGVPHVPSQAASFGYRGDDGMPGLPGGFGGNFLGIGHVFYSGQTLKISSNGGQGGPGQDGGDGKKGEDGHPAERSNNFEKTYLGERSGFYVVYAHSTEKYRIHGRPGSPGRNGGNGGIGGFGGRGGNIKVLHFDEHALSPSVESIQGPIGIDGVGGAGGEGGMGGSDLYAEKCFKNGFFTLGIPFQNNWCGDTEIWPSLAGRAASGKKGISGLISDGRKKPADEKSPPSISYVVGYYRGYMRENLKNTLKKRTLMDFMKKLNDNRL